MFAMHVIHVLAFVVTAVSATPAFRDLAVLERIAAPPTGFVAHSTADSDLILNLRIGLRQSNMAGLEQALYAISTPGHDQYGHFLSADDLVEFVKPSNESAYMVNEWLSSYGLSGKSVSNAGDWLAFSVPVHQANEMLNANFTVFEDHSGNQMVRTLSYSVPRVLADHIDLLHPTVKFVEAYLMILLAGY